MFNKKRITKFNVLNVTNQNWFSLNQVINILSKMSKNKIKRYLKIYNKKDNNKIINTGSLFKRYYPNFKFTNFKYALRKTLISYNIK